MMDSNIDIYLIGISVLVFLIITYLFIRKISNRGELKVKIEPVTDTFEIKEFDEIDISLKKLLILKIKITLIIKNKNLLS